MIVKLEADIAEGLNLVAEIRALYQTHKEAADWSQQNFIEPLIVAVTDNLTEGIERACLEGGFDAISLPMTTHFTGQFLYDSLERYKQQMA